jgi:hypothetical protein
MRSFDEMVSERELERVFFIGSLIEAQMCKAIWIGVYCFKMHRSQ